MTTESTPSLTELEIRSELFNAMDGNLRMSRRKKLLDAYKAAVLREAADTIDAKQDEYEAEEREQFGSLDHETELQGQAVRDMATMLRRMADEAGA